MDSIIDILEHSSHRPWEMPSGKWMFYQEWNDVIFIHWEVPISILSKLIPKSLKIDTFDGKAYVSLVAFTMQKIRPRYLPSLSFISDFHEINIRTYVSNENKKGVYFLNIEAQKYLSSFIAKKISGLPYEKSDMIRTENNYSSINTDRNFYLKLNYKIDNGSCIIKSQLDKWLTERYCLFLEDENDIYKYEIHHKEWELKNVFVNKLELNYKIGEIDLSIKKPYFLHYSNGVKVLSWNKNKL